MFAALNRRENRRAFTLTELAFVVVIIVVLVMLLTPFIKDIRKKAKTVSCEENLGKISLGLKLYASEHSEKFPATLEELLQGGYVDEERVFDCPSSGHIGNAKDPDYHYVTGYDILTPSTNAIVFDKEENHKGGKRVLYTSGDIVWETK